jgi:hypothetical protein
VLTQEDGKQGILLLAVRTDHARVPLMMHRPSDCDMRLDEYSRCHPRGRCGATHLSSMSAKECTARKHSTNALANTFSMRKVVLSHTRINARTARPCARGYPSEITRRAAASADAHALPGRSRRCSGGELRRKSNPVHRPRLGEQDKRVSTRLGACRGLARLGRGTAYGTRVLWLRWHAQSGFGRIGGPRFCGIAANHGHA